MSTSARSSRSDLFPYWVAMASLLLAVWLYFGNTGPAARERDELQRVADDLTDLRRRFDDAIHERRLGLAEDHHLDLQAVLVAIDQQGLTPAELCATHPLPAHPGGPGNEPPREPGAPPGPVR